MKKYNLLVFSFLILIISCNKNKLGRNPSLEEMKEYIENKHDSRATHTFDQYEQLLNKLTNDKFIVLPLNEMKDSFNNEKIIVGMRHDIDCHPFKAIKMAELEKKYGFRATYYILVTSDYAGEFTETGINRYDCMEEVYKDLHNLNCEIGIHNDLLSVMIEHELDPFVFNNNELFFYEGLNIPIYGTAAHGSQIASETVINFNMFSDFTNLEYLEYQGRKYPLGEYSLEEYGYSYEAYFVSYTNYFSESGGSWNIEGGFNQLLLKLENCEPGNRIQILTHPVWWGK